MDEDVSAEIRTAEIGQAASVVSTISEVRRILVEHQRNLGNARRMAACSTGATSAPWFSRRPDVKFFLTATPEARARRRYEEDLQRGLPATYEQTLEEITKRDERDVRARIRR